MRASTAMETALQRAICERHLEMLRTFNGIPLELVRDFETQSDLSKSVYLELARAAVRALAVVDHAHLDAARAGLPLESGLAAKFWLAALDAASPADPEH